MLSSFDKRYCKANANCHYLEITKMIVCINRNKIECEIDFYLSNTNNKEWLYNGSEQFSCK